MLKKTFGIIAFTILLYTQTLAQSFTVSGKVTDAITGEGLIGATVRIEGTTEGQITDLKGNFTLTLNNESAVLIFSFLGYIEERIPVEGRKEINVVLMPGVSLLSEMVVTAQALGQRKAINEQLRSTTISNIISSERIREVPDANAAESIGRLPGVSVKRSSGEGNEIVIRGMQPKYNLITVNGVRMPSTNNYSNAVGLAGISQYMLGGIEVRKSLTAKDDADAVGGIVDLKLANAPEGFHMNVNADGMYNSVNNTANSYRLSVQGSNRFFNNSLGVIAQVNAERADRSRHRMSANFGRYKENDEFVGIELNGGNFSFHEITRKRMGANVLADYRLPKGKILFSTMYNIFDEDSWQRDLEYQTSPIEMRKWHRSNFGSDNSFVSSLSIENTFFNLLKFDAGVSTTMGKRHAPENNLMKFEYDQRKDPPIDPSFNKKGLTGYNIIPFFRDASENYILFGLEQEEVNFIQTEQTVYTNFEIPFNLTSKVSGAIKFGGKVGVKSRDFDKEVDGSRSIHGGDDRMRTAILRENPEYNWPFDVTTRPQGEHLPAYPLYDEWSAGFLDDRIIFNDFASRGDVNRMVNRMVDVNWENFDHWLVNANDAQDDYNGNERVYAGYIMTDMKFGKRVNLNMGVRFEDETTTYKGFGIKAIANQINYPDIIDAVTRNNLHILPSTNVKVMLLDWADLRFAYSKSLARPEYYDFIPRYSADLRLTMSGGNPNLRPAVSDNLDLILSLYSNHIGLFTVGAFHKEINDFYYSRRFRVIDEELDNAVHGYETITVPKGQHITIPFNSPEKSKVQGIEFDFQTALWYLPQPFSGFVFNANYTILRAETHYYKSDVLQERIVTGPRPRDFYILETRVDSFLVAKMLDQPTTTINLAMGYDYKGFSVRLAYNYVSEIFSGVGDKAGFDDQTTPSMGRWDLSLNTKLPLKGLKAQLHINNITEVSDTRYQWQPRFLRYEEVYGRTATIGLSYSF